MLIFVYECKCVSPQSHPQGNHQWRSTCVVCMQISQVNWVRHDSVNGFVVVRVHVLYASIATTPVYGLADRQH